MTEHEKLNSSQKYTQALDFLSGLEIHGVKLGLEQVADLYAKTGNCQNSLKFIHVAGTNGKGSVAAMLASSLRECGFRTGLYTSPHLVSVRERFRIDGKAISEEELADLVLKLAPAAEEMRAENRCPTYFEFTTVLAATYFSMNKCDFVLWETGMGGRFDATNTVKPELSIITSIGLDHCGYLGNSLDEIAFEKAGIIKRETPVYCGKIPEEALDVVTNKASVMNAELNHLMTPYRIISSPDFNSPSPPCYMVEVLGNEFKLPLAGDAQPENAALCVQVLKHLSEKHGFDLKTAVRGLEKTRWPGRFQRLPDGKILDGGHNPQAASRFVAGLKNYFPDRKFTAIYGSLVDKDVFPIIEIVSEIAEKFIFVPIKASRKSYAPDELTKIHTRLSGPTCQTADSVASALKLCEGKDTVIFGSLYLAGEVLKLYFKDEEITDL